MAGDGARRRFRFEPLSIKKPPVLSVVLVRSTMVR
jgi:hypothetical protein